MRLEASRPPRWRWLLVRLLVVGLIAVGSAEALVWYENHLIFLPSRYPEGRWDLARLPAPPSGQTIDIEDAWFETEDGVRLHAWFAAPTAAERDSNALPMVLWLHGNAGNLSDRYETLVDLVNLPARVLLADYRGYGRSEGRPSEGGLYRDARAAWRELTEARHVAPERIVIFGKSLGTAPAIDLATRVRPAALIVQSGFTSIPDMAKTVFPFLPRVLVRTKMSSIDKIGRITVPKLFIHSPADEVVPYAMGRALFDAAPEPKTFLEVAGAGHNETATVGGAAYWRAMRAFVDRCAGKGFEGV